MASGSRDAASGNGLARDSYTLAAHGAADEVRTSLDALILLQHARRTTDTTSFGLPGDLYQSVIEYIAVWERSAPGGRFRGDTFGWTFASDAVQDWKTTPAFQFLARALTDPTADEGARRAVLGARLFARASREHRADLKMLGLTAALEAWLLRRHSGAQTLRLAQHVAWFGCGRHDGDLCGRSRSLRPYLHLSPDSKRDRDRLNVLRTLGNTYVPWRCSEWHRVRDWYDSRSGAAHGDPTVATTDEAGDAEYWIAHYLAEPILEWLATHSADPVGDLEAFPSSARPTCEMDRDDHRA